MQSLNHLSRNASILLVSNAGSALLSFALSVLIGRVLGKEGLGIYATTLAWVYPLSLVAEFGIGTLLTREASRRPEIESAYLLLALKSRIMLGGTLMILVWIVTPILASNEILKHGLRIAAPLILITPLFGNYTAIFRARQQMWPIPVLNVGMLVAQVSLTSLVFTFGGDILYALFINTFTSLAQLVAAWYIWHRWFRTIPTPYSSTQNNSRLYQLLVQAWPFAIAGILAAIQVRLAPIMLEKLSNTGSVGYLTAASRFAEAGRTIPNALFGAIFPILITLAAQPIALRQTFRKIMLTLAVLGSLFAIFVTLFAPTIIGVTYGEAFSAASTTLQLTIWAFVLSILRAGLTLYWYALGRESLVNYIIIIMIAIQLGISLWLIPLYGADGAVLGVLFGEIIGFCLLTLPLIGKPDGEIPQQLHK